MLNQLDASKTEIHGWACEIGAKTEDMRNKYWNSILLTKCTDSSCKVVESTRDLWGVCVSVKITDK